MPVGGCGRNNLDLSRIRMLAAFLFEHRAGSIAVHYGHAMHRHDVGVGIMIGYVPGYAASAQCVSVPGVVADADAVS